MYIIFYIVSLLLLVVSYYVTSTIGLVALCAAYILLTYQVSAWSSRQLFRSAGIFLFSDSYNSLLRENMSKSISFTLISLIFANYFLYLLISWYSLIPVILLAGLNIFAYYKFNQMLQQFKKDIDNDLNFIDYDASNDEDN